MLTVRIPDDQVEGLYALAVRSGWLRENPRTAISTKEKREAARWYVARLVDDVVKSTIR